MLHNYQNLDEIIRSIVFNRNSIWIKKFIECMSCSVKIYLVSVHKREYFHQKKILCDVHMADSVSKEKEELEETHENLDSNKWCELTSGYQKDNLDHSGKSLEPKGAIW